MKILVIHGPNLNRLGQRDTSVYGKQSLKQINAMLEKRAKGLKVEIGVFQSNSEGEIIDFIQTMAPKSDGIIINPGAFTHYSYAVRDALADTGLPIVEVHLSNIYAREEWRASSVVAPIAWGQISGLGALGYALALEALVEKKNK